MCGGFEDFTNNTYASSSNIEMSESEHSEDQVLDLEVQQNQIEQIEVLIALRASQLNGNMNTITISYRDTKKKQTVDQVMTNTLHIYGQISKEHKQLFIKMWCQENDGEDFHVNIALMEKPKNENTVDNESNCLLISVFRNENWMLNYRDLSILVKFLKFAAVLGYNTDEFQICSVNDNSMYAFSTFIPTDLYKGERLLPIIWKLNRLCTSKWRKEELRKIDGYDVDFKVDFVSACFFLLKNFQLDIGGQIVELHLTGANLVDFE